MFTLSGLQFRAATGTPFYHVRMSPAQIILIAAMIETGTRPKDLASLIGCRVETVNLWRQKLKGLTLADVSAKRDEANGGRID